MNTSRLGVAVALSPRHRKIVLFTLCLAAFTVTLDTTIVNVTLPTLVRELNASTRQLQWIVDSYNLVFAALVLAAGSIGDRFGRTGILLTGLPQHRRARGRMARRPHPRRLHRRGGLARRLRALGTTSRPTDARRRPVPQPAFHRGQRLRDHLVLRAVRLQLHGHAVLPVL